MHIVDTYSWRDIGLLLSPKYTWCTIVLSCYSGMDQVDQFADSLHDTQLADTMDQLPVHH